MIHLHALQSWQLILVIDLVLGVLGVLMRAVMGVHTGTSGKQSLSTFVGQEVVKSDRPVLDTAKRVVAAGLFSCAVVVALSFVSYKRKLLKELFA